MEKIIDKNNLNNLLQQLVNPQDRVLVLLFYKNICNNIVEATNIKIEDIDLIQNTIKIGERTKNIDDELKKEIINCIETTTYTFIRKGGRNQGYYKFNMESPYLIKNKPSVNNKQGTTPFLVLSIKNKFRIFQEVLNQKVTTSILKTSGVITCLNSNNNGFRVSLTHVENYLNDNNIKLNAYRIFKILKNYQESLI